MMKGGKREDKSIADEKWTRTAPQTRAGKNFNLKLSILSSQDEVSKYLMRYRGRLSSLIKVELYRREGAPLATGGIIASDLICLLCAGALMCWLF